MAKKKARHIGNYLVTVMELPTIFFVGHGSDGYSDLRLKMERYLLDGLHLRIEGDFPGPRQALTISKDGYFKELYATRRSLTTIINPIGRPKMKNETQIAEDSKPTNARFVILHWAR